MATVEKLLQIPEDSVPCKIRAKRGCATHPRSIAERVSKDSRFKNHDIVIHCMLLHKNCMLHLGPHIFSKIHWQVNTSGNGWIIFSSHGTMNFRIFIETPNCLWTFFYWWNPIFFNSSFLHKTSPFQITISIE